MNNAESIWYYWSLESSDLAKLHNLHYFNSKVNSLRFGISTELKDYITEFFPKFSKKEPLHIL